MTADSLRPAVLVVDDEPSVRAMAVDMFDVLGVPVFDAYNGSDALKLLEEHPEIAVLFTDVRMPGMSGVELAKRARDLRPELRIILTSAYLGEQPSGIVPHDAFVPKPYRLEHLASVIDPAAPVAGDAAASPAVASERK